MARLTFPSDRLVYSASTYAGSAFMSAVGLVATVYSDSGGTTLADVQNFDGTANAAATFTVDSTSRLPLWLGPADGSDTLYVKVGTGPVTAVYAVTSGDISAAVGAEVANRSTADAAHVAASDPHGDRAAASADATTKANAAQAAAVAAAATDATTKSNAAQAAAIAASAQRASNLSDLANATTARTNLGLGTAATHPATDFDSAGAASAAQAAAIATAATDATAKVAAEATARTAAIATQHTADNASYLAIPDAALTPDRVSVRHSDGSVGADRQDFLHVKVYDGYDGTGATLSDAAFTAAIADALASGVKRLKITGSPKISPGVLALATGGFWWVDGDNPGATQLTLASAGTLVTNGTDDAAAVDANDYSGPVDLLLSNMKIGVATTDTTLQNGTGQYLAGSVAIQDWRGGNIRLKHVRMFGIDTPFAGISSDLDDWEDVEITGAHSFSRFYSRSDQLWAKNIKWFYCDRTWDIDSVVNTVLDHPQIYGCGVPFAASTYTDLVTDGATGTVTSATATFTAADVGKVVTGTGIPDGTIVQSYTNATTVVLDNNTTVNGSGGTLNIYRTGAVNPIRIRTSSVTGRLAGAVSIRDPLFETSSNNPGNFEAFVEVAIGDAAKTTGVFIQRPTILTSTPAGGHHMSYVVKVDNADMVNIDDPILWNGGPLNYLDGLYLLTGATSGTAHRCRYKQPANAGQRRAVRVISNSTGSPLPRVLREVNGHNGSSGHPGGFRGLMLTDLIMFRESTGSDGTLYQEIVDINSGTTGTAFQWGGGTGSGSGFFNMKQAGTVQWQNLSNQLLASLAQNGSLGIFLAGVLKSNSGATGARPAAATAGVGARWYDTTLSKPIWSDGTTWRDAAGTAV